MRVPVENALRSVAVMSVEIDNADPSYLPLDLKISGSDSYIVEEAKPQRFIFFSMVTRGPHRAKGVVDSSSHQHIDCIENTSHSEHGRIVALRADLVVRVVQFAKIEQARFFEPVDVAGRMDLFYPFHFGGSSWNGDQLREKIGFFQGAVDHCQPFGSFRVPWPGFVQKESFVIKQTSSSHPVSSYSMPLISGCWILDKKVRS
jgi:hypothetical protein